MTWSLEKTGTWLAHAGTDLAPALVLKCKVRFSASLLILVGNLFSF
jgi:hypothetical protein